LSASAPLGAGSVSVRLYPHGDLAPPDLVAELRAQSALAAEHGFDGVMTSEHHGGFAGYIPNPLQAAGWCLDAMPRGWAAPCPLLLPLRPPALVAEELAAVARAVGADALNLRVHVPGVAPATAREQIAGLGDAIAPAVRDALHPRRGVMTKGDDR